ncbi:MAG: ABC transporter ATP-binding protein, partial [Actinomycetota bacterium]
LNLFAAYYPNPRDPHELSSLLGLNHLAKTTWRRLSGGEQQRLSLALALIGRPSVLFLDEPTAGVDPEGRLVIRDVVASLKGEGAAIVLTSHELSEVDAVADRLVFLARGAVLASGTRASLTASLESGSTFESRPGLDLEILSRTLESQVSESRPGHYALTGSLGGSELEMLVTALAAQGGALEAFAASSGLEDLYHALYADQPVQDSVPISRRRRR